MKHGIIVPCYNEADRIDTQAFIAFLKNTSNFEICFVNDGSKDHTLHVLHDLRRSANTDNVFVYDMPQNCGKAEAVRQGMLFLEQETSLDTIGFLDADLSTSLEEYSNLCASVERSNGRVQVVFASRNLEREGITRNPIRSFLSMIVGFLISSIVRVKIADTQCGAKVFHRNIITTAFKKQFISKWLFDIEIILRLKKSLGKEKFVDLFREQALESWTHMDGSKLGIRDSLTIPFNLLGIWTSYEFKPILSVLSHHRIPRIALNTTKVLSLNQKVEEVSLDTKYYLTEAA